MATGSTTLPTGRTNQEPLGSVILTLGLLVLFVSWMVAFSDRWMTLWAISWPALAFWMGIVLAIDFFPIRVGPLLLTLDVPVLLAIALLYSPEVAASVACLAALDMREVKGGVGLSRAVYNRAQIALSVLVAGYVLHLFGPDIGRTESLILPTLVALLVDYAVNATLVVAVRVVDGSANSFFAELWRLKVGSGWQFFGTYLAYGLLAVLFARLFVDAGGWAVGILLVSALVARQSLIRSRQLERLGRDLTKHQKLLMRALDRVVEERRDERVLIGGQLHDDVLQSIIRVRLGIGNLKTSLRTVSSPALEEVEELDRASQAAHDGLRRVIRGLRESPLGAQGLIAALGSLAKELRQEWGVRIDVELPQAVEMPASHHLALYQAAREAVLNALKHGKATRVQLNLRHTGEVASLFVTDDGVGFLPDDQLDQQQHFGLELLRERISALGGKVLIESERGRGTKISVALPLSEG